MTQKASLLNRIVNRVKQLLERIFAEPACIFDEDGYQRVFGSSDQACIQSFDCNAGDHSDACPMGK